jgi:IS5 family transposase
MASGGSKKISFDAYNESEFLPDVIERYRQREGHYPERILADKIYRNRKNLQYCKGKGIRLSGPGLGVIGKMQQSTGRSNTPTTRTV